MSLQGQEGEMGGGGIARMSTRRWSGVEGKVPKIEEGGRSKSGSNGDDAQ